MDFMGDLPLLSKEATPFGAGLPLTLLSEAQYEVKEVIMTLENEQYLRRESYKQKLQDFSTALGQIKLHTLEHKYDYLPWCNIYKTKLSEVEVLPQEERTTFLPPGAQKNATNVSLISTIGRYLKLKGSILDQEDSDSDEQIVTLTRIRATGIDRERRDELQ